jgi:hypothetical protein
MQAYTRQLMAEDKVSHWVFGLFPSSGILENIKHNVSRFGNGICFRLQVKGEKTPTQLGPLERANLQFPKRRVFCSLEYRTLEKVQKLSNSVLYTIDRTPLESASLVK